MSERYSYHNDILVLADFVDEHTKDEGGGAIIRHTQVSTIESYLLHKVLHHYWEKTLTYLFEPMTDNSHGSSIPRVPDELKKHYLSDGEGGQYSTNLDRNRYGNDDNYLFTGENKGTSAMSVVQYASVLMHTSPLQLFATTWSFWDFAPVWWMLR